MFGKTFWSIRGEFGPLSKHLFISRVCLILFSPELPEQGETVNVLIFAGADIRHVVWGPMHQEKTRMKFPLVVM